MRLFCDHHFNHISDLGSGSSGTEGIGKSENSSPRFQQAFKPTEDGPIQLGIFLSSCTGLEGNDRKHVDRSFRTKTQNSAAKV